MQHEAIKIDKTKIPQLALEILRVLSFKNDALNILKQDKNFIDYVKTVEDATKEDLKKLADHLL